MRWRQTPRPQRSPPCRRPVDVVQTVSRLVPLRIVQRSFGFPGPDDGQMLRWSWATQADMFHNPTNDRSLIDACNAAGAEMRKWIRGFLVEREPWCDAQGEDSVSRLLRMTAAISLASIPSRW